MPPKTRAGQNYCPDGDTDPDAGKTTALTHCRVESSSHLPDWKAVCTRIAIWVAWAPLSSFVVRETNDDC